MSTSPTILLTGFTPFGGATINPSWLAVRQVAETRPDVVRAVEIATVFGTAIADLETAVAEYRPEVVICVGLAEGRAAIDAFVGAAQQQFPGLVFRPAGTVDAHHNVARFTWELGPEGGEAIAVGFDVATFGDDGRFDRVTGFLDKLPA